MSSPREYLEQIFGKRTSGFVVQTQYLLAVDSLGVIAAFCLSQLILRESFQAVGELARSHWPLLALSILLRIGLNRAFGLYDRLWRYASVAEVFQLLKSACLAFLLLTLANFLLLPWLHLPSVDSMSFLVLDWLLNLGFFSGSRFCIRVGTNWLSVHYKRVLGQLLPKNRVLVVGSEDCGSMLIRIMLENPELGYIPAGIIDDDRRKQSVYVHGIPVLGTREAIPDLVRKLKIDEVIVAMPVAHPFILDDIRQSCAQVPVQVRITPDIRVMVTGRITVDHLRQWRSTVTAEPTSPSEPIYRVQNILVPGGAGFIGSNFARYMLAAHPDYRVVVYDKLTYAGNLDNLHGLKQAYGERLVFTQGDICDAGQLLQVMQTYSIDAIVNFAAETHVDRSLSSPDHFLHTNILGTFQLLEAARHFNVTRYHQVSTDEVYGQVLRGSFSEDDPLETRSPYSASKAAADLYVHAYFNSYGVPVTVTRSSNNIGPYQYPEKAVPLFITNALEDKPLPIYGDGLYVRDYLYVRDHCCGIDLVLHKGILGEVYNLGSGTEVEAITLAKMILDQLEKPHSLIRFVDDRKGQDRRYSLNCSKVKALGWAPKWSFDQALATTIAWYIENEWWWRHLKSGEYAVFYERQYRQRLMESVQYSLAD